MQRPGAMMLRNCLVVPDSEILCASSALSAFSASRR